MKGDCGGRERSGEGSMGACCVVCDIAGEGGGEGEEREGEEEQGREMHFGCLFRGTESKG